MPSYTVTGDATGAVFDLPDSHGTLTIKVLNGDYGSTSLEDPTLARVTLWENRAGIHQEAHNLPDLKGLGTANTFSKNPNESTFHITVRERDDTPYGHVRCEFDLAFETPSGNVADFRDLTYTFSVKKADDSQLEEEGYGGGHG